MPNRTEMLHFRATPEEKTRIKENARRWDSLSGYLSEAALEYALESDRLEAMREQLSDAIPRTSTGPTEQEIDNRLGETYEQSMREWFERGRGS